ncbi:type II toxin-antitoxin system RelE/ParE family toxin [Burkholderia sp. Bp9142]|uniref:type II toxin-antitoxin system RelE/ParE family toxin n=1 Tax=Burkholderia sp. Bp9142 TaxID=2184573 RepID=UPI000F5B465E|nr:type II toxin-antitoxin system RelE/ParE family toxin [Burkholderia sp. Bp9142]RQR35875.1 type II toxin-antitoxin system RelE/ParE family toxin [Burkholderia sp. Bp9142]
MARQQIQITLGVRFFRTARGNEPVREWLKALGQIERRVIGEEIKTVQLGWPLGMPLVRKMSNDLWEIRVMLPRRSARVLFTAVGDTMVLLHAFFKQSQATPSDDLDVTVAQLKALTRAI